MSSSTRLWISHGLDPSSSVAEHIQYAGASAHNTNTAPPDKVAHHFRDAHYSILGAATRARRVVIELAPGAIDALHRLDEMISERRKNRRRVDPLASACQNFVRGNPLSDPSAPLIATILGDVEGTVFESGTVPDASISHVSKSLERALQILMERTKAHSVIEEADEVEVEPEPPAPRDSKKDSP